MEIIQFKPLKRLCSVIVFTFLFMVGAYAQNSVWGKPMLGPVTPTTAQVWFGVNTNNAGNLKAYLVAADSVNKQKTVVKADSVTWYNVENSYSVKAFFSGLQPSTTYSLVLYAGNYYKGTTVTTSSAQTQPYNFQFLAGSCGLFGKGVLRLLSPKNYSNIYTSMANENASFMLWLGDNFYYQDKDFYKPKNMFKRQKYYRSKIPKLSAFLNTQPNYAIWDDHDYGPNNSDKTYTHKNKSLAVHKAFWPAVSYGQNQQGIYHTFTVSDVQFFMLDDRWYRSVEEGTMLGAEQFAWLKQALRNSTATFKIIAIGSQVLNNASHHECFATEFPDEKQALINFLTDNNITGVVFLTGDRHFASVNTQPRNNAYTLYDITSSALTSPMLKSFAKHDVASPNVIKESLFFKHNYGLFTVNGKIGNRVLNYVAKNIKGNVVYSLSLNENELK